MMYIDFHAIHDFFTGFFNMINSSDASALISDSCSYWSSNMVMIPIYCIAVFGLGLLAAYTPEKQKVQRIRK